MRISDWSSDVCSSDLSARQPVLSRRHGGAAGIDEPAAVADATAALPARRLYQEVARRSVGAGLSLQRTRTQGRVRHRSEEHTSELQSLMRISYAVFCLTNKKDSTILNDIINITH